jgi:hypothetical protein
MVHFKMLFRAAGAEAFARLVVAQVGQLIASADAVAVAGGGSCFDGNQSHGGIEG